MATRSLLAMLGIAALAAICQAAPATPKTKPAPILSAEQQREANRVLAEFRSAGGDVEKKLEAARKAVAMGPVAMPPVAAALDREMRPLLKRYSGRFQQQASTMAKKRSRNADAGEVQQLRRTVLGLQKQGEAFTKDLIVSKGDPAMTRLRELLVVDRTEVLDQVPDLKAERKKLEAWGPLWELCQANLPKAAEDAKPAAKRPSFEAYLSGEEDLAASLAAPMDAKTRAVITGNAKLAERMDAEEVRAMLALNLTRNLLGLSALAIDTRLADAARDHSHDMETQKFFAHDSPVEGKRTPWDRAKRMGTSASSENIFFGGHDGKAANDAWFHSPGHHKNMLGDHSRVGVGRSGTHYTEMFGK